MNLTSKQKLDLIIDFLLQSHGNEDWILPEAIDVHFSGYGFDALQIHGLKVSKCEKLYIMFPELWEDELCERWEELNTHQINSDVVISAIFSYQYFDILRAKHAS